MVISFFLEKSLPWDTTERLEDLNAKFLTWNERLYMCDRGCNSISLEFVFHGNCENDTVQKPYAARRKRERAEAYIFRLVYCGPMFFRCLKFPPVLSNGLQRVSQGPLCGDREAAGIV